MKTRNLGLFVLGILSLVLLASLASAELDYCNISSSSAIVANITVDSPDIKTLSGFGDDENYWYPGDEVQIKVEIENTGVNDLKSVKVKWALYTDETTPKKIISDAEDSFSLDSGDSKKVTFSFTIDPEDVDTENENYVLYLSATGTDRETSTVFCGESTPQPIEIRKDDNFVILQNIELPETTTCDSDVTITADVWNIGTENQDDVYVTLFNKDLGLNNVKINIGSIDSFDKTELSYTFNVPKGTPEKLHDIEFRVYDEDKDIFQNSEDDESRYIGTMTVKGNCALTPEVSVSANVQSGGKAGEDLVIKAVITNTGDVDATYALSTENTAWASDVAIDKPVLALKKGESAEVLFTLETNADAAGEQTFNIKLSSNNAVVKTQPVPVTLEKSGFSFNFLTGNVVNSDNWYLWGIGVLNVILVIIIIIVAIRVARS